MVGHKRVRALRKYQFIIKPFEHLVNMLSDIFLRRLCGVAHIEHDLQFARRDIGHLHTAANIGDDHLAWCKILISVIKMDPCQTVQHCRDLMYRVDGFFRIRGMPLFAVYRQITVDRPSSAYLDRITESLFTGRFGNDAIVRQHTDLLEMRKHDLCPVCRFTFFI